MNRNEWIRRNNQDSSVPSTRKKKRGNDFNPGHDFIDKEVDKFLKSGGKIKIPVETS